jgi:hypothetical protein
MRDGTTTGSGRQGRGMGMARLRGRTSLIALLSAGWVASAGADAVTDWNAIAVETIITAAPPTSQIDLGLVQAAVHDAVQAIDGRFEPYHVRVPGASGRREAAVAAAAHDVLVGFYPSQKDALDAIYKDYLNSHGLNGDPGLAVGQTVAAGFIPLQRLPPDPPPPPFLGGDEPGEWRPTDSLLVGGTGPNAGLPGPPFGPPPPFAPGSTPWVATLQPLTLKSPHQFRARPPLPLHSGKYRREYDEVKTLGSRLDSGRTPEQTDLGYFFAGNFLRIWWGPLRAIADQYLDDLGDRARLLALAGLAGGDAVITAWDTKYHYTFWRPMTAIREGDHDGNPKTTGDPMWEPLINTPPYPDHTSGANNVNAAYLHSVRLLLGTDRIAFVTSTNFPLAIQKDRQYERLSDMERDVVNVRVYQGIHFRRADVLGRRQGHKVARWVFRHYLRPVDECDDDDQLDDDDDDDDGDDEPHPRR